MPTIAEDNIILRILAETKKARQDINKLDKDVDELGESTNSVNDQFARIGKFARNAAIVGVIYKATQGMIRLTRESAKAYAEFESTQKSFEVLVGDIGRARDLLKELTEFSERTPFTPQEIQRSAKTLLGFGRSVKETLVDIRQLGEISAATGAELSNIALVYGQVASLGKLQGQDALQFINAGIPIYDLLSQSLGKSVAELKELQSQGKITFADLEKAISEATEEGGKFFGALEAQSKTLSGLQSTLQGRFESLHRVLGERLAPVIRASLGLMNTLVGSITEKLDESNTDFFIRIAAGIDASTASLGDFFRLIQAGNVYFNTLAERFNQISKLPSIGDLVSSPFNSEARGRVQEIFSNKRENKQALEEARLEFNRLLNDIFGGGGGSFNDAYRDALEKYRQEQLSNPETTGSAAGDIVVGTHKSIDKAKSESKKQIDELVDINFQYFIKARDRLRNQVGDQRVGFLETLMPGLSGRPLEGFRQDPGLGEDSRSLIQRVFGIDGEVQQRIFRESGNILLESARQLTNGLVDEEIRRTDLLLRLSEDRLRQLQQIAGEGNAEQLQLEEERQRTLLERRQEFIDRQRQLNAIEIAANNAVTISNLIAGISKTFAANPILGILQGAAAAGLIASTIASVNAALSSVPAFWTGTENVNGPGGIDNVPAMLSKGERVVDRNTNKTLNQWGVKNDDLVPLIGSALGKYQPTSLYQSNTASNKDYKKLAAKLDKVEQAIYGIRFNVNIDPDGIGVAAGNYRNRMNKRKKLMS